MKHNNGKSIEYIQVIQFRITDLTGPVMLKIPEPEFIPKQLMDYTPKAVKHSGYSKLCSQFNKGLE
jgi:hypothetical protein